MTRNIIDFRLINILKVAVKEGSSCELHIYVGNLYIEIV